MSCHVGPLGSPYDSELRNLKDLGSHLTNTCRQQGDVESAGQNEQGIIKLLSEISEVQSAQLRC